MTEGGERKTEGGERKTEGGNPLLQPFPPGEGVERKANIRGQKAEREGDSRMFGFIGLPPSVFRPPSSVKFHFHEWR